MKKILFVLMAMFALCLKCAYAQDAPLKIVTGHPDFKIKVKRCAASGRTVVIDMIFSNEGTNDVKVEFLSANNSSSSLDLAIYDDEGNIYKSAQVKVSNMPSYQNAVNGFELITGVPMKVSLKIDDVSVSSEKFALVKMDVTCNSWGIGRKEPVTLRNIPITRD